MIRLHPESIIANLLLRDLLVSKGTRILQQSGTVVTLV
jgi:hypothetical protein